MCAVPFNDLHKNDLKLKDLQKIQRLVKERIPTGFTAPASPFPVFHHAGTTSRILHVCLLSDEGACMVNYISAPGAQGTLMSSSPTLPPCAGVSA